MATESSATARTYDWRSNSSHEGDDNATIAIHCALRRDGEGDFEPYVLDVQNSAFMNFQQCILTCQLAYLRMNAVERGILVDRVEGEMQIVSDSFHLKVVRARFTMVVRSGDPTEADLAHIRERCLACPVSRNLHNISDKDTEVRWVRAL